ncbi:GGDEF domain-containing protein [Salinibius halmophilus]|uniref:GGDEF domain-containing protein n=1 Tax=Salinibius halmophilus TaxID=1853216 RepID=UPI000E670892|nr:GGDEF domain-containing protein [Salinibius halmophilus]
MNIRSAKHQWLTLLLPTFVVVCMLFAIDYLSQASLIFRAQLQIVPYFAAFMTMVLATQFHQYRFVFLTLVLTLSYAVFSQIFRGDAALSPLGLYWGLSVVSCLAFLYVILMRETYPWQLSGILQITLIILPFLVLLQPQTTRFLRTLVTELPDSLFDSMSSTMWTSPLTATMFALVIFLAIRAWWANKDASSGGAVPAIVACFAAMTWLSEPLIGLALFVGASVALMANIFLQAWVYAYRDELTGIPSRRAFQQYCHRLNRRYVIAMIDIDHFKGFNDTYGHDVGDDVLRVVASRMSRVKGGGKVFRLGGEEFAMVFPRKSVEKSLPYIEQVRKQIASNPITIRNFAARPEKDRHGKVQRGSAAKPKQVRITVSIGVAEPNNLNRRPKAVLRLADQLLYRAKEQGRNQVVH